MKKQSLRGGGNGTREPFPHANHSEAAALIGAFVGYWLNGLSGALLSTVAIFVPPILMIIFLIPFYQIIKESRWRRPIIQGFLVALMGMLVVKYSKMCLKMGQIILVKQGKFL